jgi:hypothetical protein
MVLHCTLVSQASKDNSSSSSKEYKRSHTTPLPDTSPIDGGSSSSSACGVSSAAQVASSKDSQHSKAAAGLRQGIAAAITKLSMPFDSSSSSDPKVQALEYKHQHGYLPSPSASSPGNRQSLRQATSIRSSLSRACSSKLAQDNSIGGLNPAEDDDDDEIEVAVEDDGSLLPALSPGAVPVFGSSGPATAATSAAAAAAGVSYGNIPAPSSSSIKAAPSSSSSSSQPSQLQRQQPAATASIAAAQVPKSLSLAPANVLEPTLLAVSPRLAPAMQRACWCMADFVIQKKLYEGYASTICKVSCCYGGVDSMRQAPHDAVFSKYLHHRYEGYASMIFKVCWWYCDVDSMRLAPAMQRSCWCMAEFVIQKKLYEVYASTICKVSWSQVLWDGIRQTPHVAALNKLFVYPV